jgi:hypothetical protein
MTIHGVTFEWTEPHVSGGMAHCSLGDSIVWSGSRTAWCDVLAANLAIAALLGRAADIGYEEGLDAQAKACSEAGHL